jgi:UPF0042 nucleotide-binding protein
METIIITGLSGAGKSQAVRCMEDMGYYCIDNMPPRLIKAFIEIAESGSDIEKAAFVVDVRGGRFFNELKSSLDELEAEGKSFKIMFLEAMDEVLIRRYKESRRSHPLAKEGTIIEGIRRERDMLQEVRSKASYVIDTSNTKTAAFNEELKRLLLPGVKDSFTITVESFGYKKGMPLEADWVLDARFAPNPFYLSSLKKLTGNNKKVREYVMGFPVSRDFVDSVSKMILKMIPSYVKEGKSGLTVAIGCTGGQHRSVVFANELSKIFKAEGKHTVVIHRDL